MRVYLVRHGKATTAAALRRDTDAIADGETPIHYDELHPVGMRQAQRLGAHLARVGQRFDHVFCGPMRRHRTTLELMRSAAADRGIHWPKARELESVREVALDALVREHLPRLVEEDDDKRRLWSAVREGAEHAPMHEAAPFVRLVTHLVAKWRAGTIVSEGVETWPVFRARVRAALREVIAASEAGAQVAIVTSMGVINEMLTMAEGEAQGPNDGFRWLWTTSLSRVTVDEGRIAVEYVDDTPHLDAEPELRTLL
jgi:broad specificity phosphatase PhoE